MSESILNGKRILAVDDEPDILETLADLLEDYEGLIFDRATDYETGFHLLRSWTYDAVILDIMGVRGFDLLNASVHLGFPTAMLTAHAFSVQDLKRSIEMGARAYIPKERMDDVFRCHPQNHRLASRNNQLFGHNAVFVFKFPIPL